MDADPASVPDFDEAVVVLAPDLDAPALARSFVTAHRDHLPDDVVNDARLLVSEIVTNAVLHGRGEITLRVRLAPPGIGIAVRDNGPDLGDAHPERPADDQSSGRGLLILNAVAHSWGVVSEKPSGKTVWFELRDA